jgi:predicted HicB family RNase H-like nuclease
MAKVTNALDTYTAIGQREDLSEEISMISPEETPVLSDGRTVNKPKARYFEWQTDALDSPDDTNAQLEGDNIAMDAITPTARVGNYQQISRKTASVTGSEEAVNKAGRKSDLAREIGKKLKALKTDVDKIMCGVQGQVAGNATTARKSRALESWIATNSNRGTGGADAASATAAPTDGTQRAFTETILKDTLQTCYNSGAKPTNLYLGAFNRRVASGFAGRSTIRQATGKAEVYATVDVYVSDFGTIHIKPSRHIRSRTGLLLNPEFYGVADLRKTFSKTKGIVGDAIEKFIIREWGLKVHNEAAHAVIADLTTS